MARASRSKAKQQEQQKEQEKPDDGDVDLSTPTRSNPGALRRSSRGSAGVEDASAPVLGSRKTVEQPRALAPKVCHGSGIGWVGLDRKQPC